MQAKQNFTIQVFIGLIILISNICSYAQSKPVIKLTNPLKDVTNVTSTRQYIVGSTCKDCTVMINEERVKVYPTGGFAYACKVSATDSVFTIVAISGEGKSSSKRIYFRYQPPKPELPVKDLRIEYIETSPANDLMLQAGDHIRFKVKALPGAIVSLEGDIPLYEVPASQSGGMAGIYRGEYIVSPDDTFRVKKFRLTLADSTGKSVVKETPNSYSIIREDDNDVVLTKGRLAHLEYGLGEDRLGGAKIGYIDSMIALKVTGKFGSHYRVQLAPSRTAYIPDDVVTVMPKGSFPAESLTDKWNVYGDDKFDYVTINLFARLPYQSMQLTDPSRIVVDIFGATNNTNWIAQLQSAKEILHLDYEQIADGIFRVNIRLKHKQHWGHQVYYKGNMLVIKIRQQPKELSLKNLTIGVDAGHGGSNTGAGGPTGVAEKTITLDLSLKLQKALEQQGAKVIMSRTTEKFFDNKERILFYRDSTPDLLLSIHLNSSGDPINTEGTSTFYRYIGFKPLSQFIYKRMLELGLKEYGNNGSFNFMLNSPTEYPNALIETVFLSNPKEEAKILDESFQQSMVDKIVAGVKDFLENCR